MSGRTGILVRRRGPHLLMGPFPGQMNVIHGRMMLMMESAVTVRFSAANVSTFTALHHCRSIRSSDEIYSVSLPHRLNSGSCGVRWSRFRRSKDGSILRKSSLCVRKNNFEKNRIQASTGYLDSASDSPKHNRKQDYHPFEEMESTSENCPDARLTAAETARTIVEVNSKATLMFTDLINEDIHENFIWPELPYVNDEHGNIYFQVKNDEDILQTLTSENNFVQVIIGFDTMEMMQEIGLSGPSEIDFGIEEIEDEDSDDEDGNDDDEEDDDEDEDSDDDDWVAVHDDGEDDSDSDETLGDWAKLDTMRYSHPMSFAKTLTQVASDEPFDWMEQPPAGLAIQGLIRPALIEEHSDIQRHMCGSHSRNADKNHVQENVKEELDDLGQINGNKQESEALIDGSILSEESIKDEIPQNGTLFYKLEMVKIQLISVHGHKTVEVEDFGKAQPDAIAHSVAKIISRMKAGGEKFTQAFRSLCWRCKGIQVEEVAVIGVDSLGFDLRVCSGAQIQTLRFPFTTRASSEYSAERQLNDLLFPRIHHKPHKKKQTQQNEI